MDILLSTHRDAINHGQRMSLVPFIFHGWQNIHKTSHLTHHESSIYLYTFHDSTKIMRAKNTHTTQHTNNIHQNKPTIFRYDSSWELRRYKVVKSQSSSELSKLKVAAMFPFASLTTHDSRCHQAQVRNCNTQQSNWFTKTSVLTPFSRKLIWIQFIEITEKTFKLSHM